jgi:metal-sulfur cluster biosynthetic enzyme
MIEPEKLKQAVLDRLSQVIDPETNVDVVRMGLIEDLHVSDDGRVAYRFRPSSALCPIAIPLSQEIQKAVAEVENVTGQDFEIVGYLQSEDLNKLLKEFMKQFE